MDAPDPTDGQPRPDPTLEVAGETDPAQAAIPHHLLLQQAPDPMILVDQEGTIQLANQATVDLFGYPRDELLGAPVEVLVPEALQATHVGHRETYMDSPGRRPMGSGLELEARRADGSTIPVEISLSPVPIDGVAHVMATVRDVTDRRQAKQRFEQLLEAAPDAVILVDPEGTIELVNRQTEELFDHRRETLIGQPIEVLVPDALRVEHIVHRERYMRDPSLRPMGMSLDLWGQRSDRTEFPVEISIAPIETEAGPRVMATVRDMTERRAAEQAEREAKQRLAEVERRAEIARLEEINRFKTAFINTAAHELATPLTPIVFQLEILRNVHADQLTETQREALEILARSIGRLRSLVDDVLDGARLQANRLDVHVQDTLVADLVDEAVEAYQGAADEKAIELTTEVPGDLVAATDEKRMMQVLYNLLSNAIKYTPEGGKVRVTAEPRGDEVMVCVEDTGIGLTQEQAEQAFEPFTRVHEDRVPEAGTGLGLYISEGVVDRLGGTLTCHSGGPGEGTTFAVLLPAATLAPGDEPAEAGRSSGEEVDGSTGPAPP